MKKILILDNYDSFTYNLSHLIQKNFSGEVIVKRDIELQTININDFCVIIISPGPGNPQTTPVAMNLISKNYRKIPILGICLGMQCINYFFNGETIKGIKPVHGKTSKLIHNSQGLYNNIPNEIDIARYHSLQIILGKNLEVTGRTSNYEIMSIKHSTLPIYGLQFHPESFLSEYGDSMIKNFLKLAGIDE